MLERADLAKALELRMESIAAGTAPKHLAREERLAPQRDEALGIEIARMQ